MSDSIERIVSAAVEGQAQSLRFIQQQLNKLHTALIKASSEIQNAISSDTKHSTAEIDIQYALALNNVASLFAESNFDAALEAEYKLAKSENNAENRAPYGIVYIVPSKFNLFYSCLTAVAAAIAAGNCVILELPQTLSATSVLLQKILSQALDRDTFATVDKRIDTDDLPNGCIFLHGSPESNITSSSKILTVPSTRSVAIVDRYADMQQAARAILRARFAFGGQSPIAPDLVLVNEFRIKEFCAAIAAQTTRYFAEQLEMNGVSQHSASAKARASRTSSLELDKAGAETVISGSRGIVVRVNDRSSSILRKKINEPLIVIHSVKSLDDAMDFANSDTDEPLAALLAFGSPDVGKYVSQFTNCHLCCVNDVPAELLVSPLTPIGFSTQPGAAYRKEMFSTPKPQYIKFSEASRRLSTMLDQNDRTETAKLRKSAQLIDTKVKQAPGHAIGFFEQGLLFGVSVTALSIVTGSVVIAKYGVPAIMKRL